MRSLLSLFLPVAVLLLRVSGQHQPPHGRHAAGRRRSEAGGTPAPRRAPRPRPYAAEVAAPPAPAPGPSRIPDRDAFYRLAELSPHAPGWNFTYDHTALAPYTARNRAEPQMVIAAARVADLGAMLDSITSPAWPRPAALTAQQRSAAALERGELDRLVRAGAGR
ncbi:hypothetical protein HNR23_000287 [Nocardiopsis mwathae]|uniref:Uncharacterized protein n=1 Tax=Nocardiopsis mwathae TaxID=1472723 RepID=A0A7W9YDQ6_9ACTN|nr:hypothetical protein [Nocardiopsis mwathae]MBB6170227.1 hypothetical protein [Nocardiopsis mwathae]